MSNMAASSTTPETSTTPLNHLGFIESSVNYIVDGSCQFLDAGLDAAVKYTGDTCRPCAEKIKQRTSEIAKSTAVATKQGTTSVLQRLDPTVDRAISSARTTNVTDVFTKIDQAADRAASHPRVQLGYRYAKDKYGDVHASTVASPTYEKVYSSAADGVSTLTSRVKRSRVYAEHVAAYAEPLAQRLKSSSYYKAAVEHIKPARLAGETAEGAPQGQNMKAAAATTAAPSPSA